MDRYVLIAGRVLLSFIFLLSGFGKIANWGGNESMMASKGVPLPAVALAIAIVFEIVGGLSLLSGYYARWGALALFLYLIPVSFTIHNFWASPEAEHQNQMIHFMKNLSIMGGLLVAASASLPARHPGLPERT
jgi:putative oxidoreductase